MIYYRPTDGGPNPGPISWKPRTAFIMQQLADPVPPEVESARRTIDEVLKAADFATIDADAETTGGDFLLKIWSLAIACPVGIAIVHQGISPTTLANIYYELGLMQAYGRETAVVRIGKPALPSDFVRTEYLKADGRLEGRLRSLMKSIANRATYYEHMANQLENDPLLSIDYLRRAYLISERKDLRTRANEVFSTHGLASRGGSSVEKMLLEF